VVWRKPSRRRRARHRQVRLNSRDHRSASVSSGDGTPPEFDGYAVELLTAVADLLRIRFEFYAVPAHGSSSVHARTHDYGMWSPLVDQLITEASSHIARFPLHIGCFLNTFCRNCLLYAEANVWCGLRQKLTISVF